MSRLRIFWPDESNSGVAVADFEPTIPFRPVSTANWRGSTALSSRDLNVVQRAQAIFENRQCPDCQHPAVELLEMDDAVLNRKGFPIPGTATLLGFHCDCCGKNWPV